MTARQKTGVSIMVSGVLGIIVGFVVYKTASTPVFVDVIITAAVTVIGSIIGVAVTKPEIPT